MAIEGTFLKSSSLFLLLIFSSYCHAISLDVGLAAGGQTFHIDKNDGTDLGELSEELSVLPYISLRIDEKNMLWGDWGYFVAFDLGLFDLDMQYTNEKEVDLGTRVSGEYAYLTYVLINKNVINPDSSIYYGIGAGLGYLQATGTAVLTELSAQPRVNIDVNDVYISAGLYFEYLYKDWIFSIKGYGPRITEGEYDYQLSDIKIIFGKRIEW